MISCRIVEPIALATGALLSRQALWIRLASGNGSEGRACVESQSALSCVWHTMMRETVRTLAGIALRAGGG